MQRQDYAEQLLQHYESPRYYGALPDAEVVSQVENPGCGDVITIYMRMNDKDTVDVVHFEGEGCTISLAATSVLMEMVQGKSLAQIQAIDYNSLIDKLGKEVVLTRVNCATLGLKALKEAIRNYYTQQVKVNG
jgi:nitrogen fixation NifU-like protein